MAQKKLYRATLILGNRLVETVLDSFVLMLMPLYGEEPSSIALVSGRSSIKELHMAFQASLIGSKLEGKVVHFPCHSLLFMFQNTILVHSIVNLCEKQRQTESARFPVDNQTQCDEQDQPRNTLQTISSSQGTILPQQQLPFGLYKVLKWRPDKHALVFCRQMYNMFSLMESPSLSRADTQMTSIATRVHVLVLCLFFI